MHSVIFPFRNDSIFNIYIPYPFLAANLSENNCFCSRPHFDTGLNILTIVSEFQNTCNCPILYRFKNHQRFRWTSSEFKDEFSYLIALLMAASVVFCCSIALLIFGIALLYWKQLTLCILLKKKAWFYIEWFLSIYCLENKCLSASWKSWRTKTKVATFTAWSMVCIWCRTKSVMKWFTNCLFFLACKDTLFVLRDWTCVSAAHFLFRGVAQTLC